MPSRCQLLRRIELPRALASFDGCLFIAALSPYGPGAETVALAVRLKHTHQWNLCEGVMTREGEMRATLLTVIIMMAVLPSRSFAVESFNCFDTPNGEHKCACIGVAGCKEMQQSGNCKSELVCDQDQLGAIICSCSAGRTSRSTSLN